MANGLPNDVTFTPPTQSAPQAAHQTAPAQHDMSDVTFTPPSTQSETGSTGSILGDLAIGALKGGTEVLSGIGGGVAETAEGVKNLANKGVNLMLPPGEGVKIPDIPEEYRKERNTGEQIGGGAEQVAEFMAGDAALEGLAKATKMVELADKYPLVAKTLALAKDHPVLAKMITTAGNVAKGAATGGAQGAVKGAAEGKTVEEAEGGAAGGAAGTAAGEVIKGLSNSDLAKAMMNRASGVTKNMIRYGQDPAKALVEEDLPVFSTLTNKGREIAAQTKLDELKPALDSVLAKSPVRVNINATLGKALSDARQEIADNLTMTPEEKSEALHHINSFQDNLMAKYPTGDASILEANDLKSRIGREGAEFDKKPNASDLIRGLYRDVYGALKDEVNKNAPAVVGLNQRVANLVALKEAAHETIIAERAGIGPLSGFGVARKIEAAAGHAAPIIARASKPIAKVAAGAGALGGEKLEENAETTNPSNRLYFRDSQGSVHSIPPDQLGAARQIDPNLQIITQP